MSIGERLRKRRQELGLSLGQVGEYEGITPQYLSDLERGRNQPNVWTLLTRLARRYRTTADYLLGLSDDPAPAATPLAPDAALLARLPGPQRAVVRSLLRLLAQQSPDDQQFTLEVIQRLLLPVQPHIIGEDPDEPETDPESD